MSHVEAAYSTSFTAEVLTSLVFTANVKIASIVF